MAKGDERDRPEDLYPFAEALVRKLKVRHQLQWSEHRMEDAIQDLFLAGWQVWQDEEDVGLAKNRMRDRAKNLLRDFQAELTHEPRASSEHPKPGRHRRFVRATARTLQLSFRSDRRRRPGREMEPGGSHQLTGRSRSRGDGQRISGRVDRAATPHRPAENGWLRDRRDRQRTRNRQAYCRSRT